MSNLVFHPDEQLRLTSLPVEPDHNVRDLVAEMIDTMYSSKGIGLAAIQIGHPLRIIVVDASEMKQPPIVLVNPEIIFQSPTATVMEEGCLSIPGMYAEVERPSDIIVQYHDLDGGHRVQPMDGLLGRCLQHEMDHLGGVLFIDHLSRLKRQRLMRQYSKRAK